MEDAKALLAVMSGLSGVVVGYYFGRVPGEAHASRAQDQMQKMQGKVGGATAKLVDLEDSISSGKPVNAGDIRHVRRMISQA